MTNVDVDNRQMYLKASDFIERKKENDHRVIYNVTV